MTSAMKLPILFRGFLITIIWYKGPQNPMSLNMLKLPIACLVVSEPEQIEIKPTHGPYIYLYLYLYL